MDLKESINDQIELLQDAVNAIKLLDGTIEATEDNELKDEYLEFLLQTINEYKEICAKLRIDLETYFEYEKENKVPLEFNYHKLAKALDSIRV